MESDFELQYGNFAVYLPDNLELSSDDEYLRDVNLDELETAAASSVSSTIDQHILQEILQQSAIENIPKPEMPCTPSPANKRFKSVSKEQMDELFDARQSNATKKNTIWGMRIFQGIYMQVP